MKKFFTFILLFSLLAITSANHAAASQTWWGYYLATENRTATGYNAKATVSQAIFIPGNTGAAQGKTIKGVRLYMRSFAAISGLKVWISRSLPSAADKADYVQTMNMVDMNNGDESSESLGKQNDITLDKPYVIPAEGVYVGYTFTVRSTNADYGKHPTCVADGDIEGGLFMAKGSTWTDYSKKGKGHLALQVQLDGEFYNNALSPHDFGTQIVAKGGSVKVPIRVTNDGTATVKDFDYTVAIDGTTSAEKHVSLAQELANINESTTGTIELQAADRAVSQQVQVTITKVNGQPNESGHATATGKLNTLGESFERNVLVEEFTTEKCPNCPSMATMMKNTLNRYPQQAARVALVCHHSGFYTDQFTTSADNAYTWFYNDAGATYAPALMFDRYPYTEADNTGLKTPVLFASNSSEIIAYINNRLNTPAYLDLDAEAAFNADSTSVTVWVTAKRAQGYEVTPRLAVVLTENDIASTSQAGYSGTFYHAHVMRDINSTWGVDVDNWTDNQATYSYTFDLKNNWNRSNLQVVAYIGNYDSTDASNCVVENSVAVNPAAYTPASGDIDGDGTVNVSDATALVNKVLGEADYSNLKCDINGDGTVNVSDVTALISIILSKGN